MDLQVVQNRVVELFRAVSRIPRPSYKEDRIADFICDFAEKCGCEYYRDEANNVLVNVKATAGMEGREPILLQGHLDMVCEKNEGVCHDFNCEGISIIEKDGWLVADGTTLGADNGVAVAIMLFVIEGGVGEHGDVQCLFTTSEEVGLDGVKAFDFSRIYARKLINMDGENERAVIVGCAGGVCTDVRLPVSYTETSGELVKIKISGLCGGHSGEDINSGRANACILMGQLLSGLLQKTDISLVSINGGTKDNAIPREATAYIAARDFLCVREVANAFLESVRGELSQDDERFSISCEQTTDKSGKMMDTDSTNRVVAFLSCVKNGIIEMSKKLPELVEYSKNLGVVRSEDGEVLFVINSRSTFEYQLDASVREIAALASLCGANIRTHGHFTGWSYSGESAIADEYIAVCRELYGNEVERVTIHAGLECGIIKAALPDIDPISCGPNMKNLHSPDEALDVASFARFAHVIATLISTKR